MGQIASWDGAMWQVAAAPYLAAAALLVLAGAPKVLDPLPLVRALRSAGLGRLAVRPLVRAVALAETVVGVAALAIPSRVPAALVAAAYLTFSGFVLLALRRGGVLASCGCIGRSDTPPTRTHLALTLVLSVAAGAVAVAPPGPGVWDPAGLDPTTVALVGYAALLAFLGYVVIAVLPLATPQAVRSASGVRRDQVGG